MAINKDEIIFDNKTLADLFSDIYKNSKNKSKRIDLLLDSVKDLVTGISEAALVLPILKEVLEIGVKNDEQLIKLAGVVQRLLTGGNNNTGTNELLTEDEKKHLLKSAHVDKTLTSEENSMDVDEQILKLEKQVAAAKLEVKKGDKKLLGELDVKNI